MSTNSDDEVDATTSDRESLSFGDTPEPLNLPTSESLQSGLTHDDDPEPNSATDQTDCADPTGSVQKVASEGNGVDREDTKNDAVKRKESVSSITDSIVMDQIERGASLFDNVQYLGSSTVDAPVSETEANRKMTILKTQAKDGIPIVLVVPPNNGGSIVLKDAAADQPLAAFMIRHILFAARGQMDTELDGCFAINVLHKRSGVYHCHVFHCKGPETVSTGYMCD